MTLNTYVVGGEVEQIVVDFAFTLRFSGGYTMTIENDFEVSALDGTMTVFVPDGDRALLGPLLSLHAQAVTAATMEETGALMLTFSDGRVLHAHGDDRYESWHLGGPGGVIYTCLPGGDVAVWGPPIRR